MESTIIDFYAYKEQQTDSNSINKPMSAELIIEIQLLIQRLKDSNPIKQTGKSA